MKSSKPSAIGNLKRFEQVITGLRSFSEREKGIERARSIKDSNRRQSLEEQKQLLRREHAGTTAHQKKGAETFATHCAVCHGAEGNGDGPGASGLVDVWEEVSKPAMLSAPHHKSGDKPTDLYPYYRDGDERNSHDRLR